MEFREKIDKVLKIKKIKLWKLAEISSLGNTLEKAYEKNREMRDAQTVKLLQNVSINPDWWERQTGEVIIEKPYNVDKTSDNNGKQTLEDKALEAIAAGSIGDYLIIPKNLLQDKHRLVPIEVIEREERIINKLMDDNLALNRRVNELEAKLPEVQKTQ